jgi:hypothetical protein
VGFVVWTQRKNKESGMSAGVRCATCVFLFFLLLFLGAKVGVVGGVIFQDKRDGKKEFGCIGMQ